MKISPFQIIARILLTVMTVGALIVLLKTLVLEMIFPTAGISIPSGTETVISNIINEYILSFSFLMEATALPAVQEKFWDYTSLARPFAVQIVLCSLVFLAAIAVLILIKHITSRKGTRTAISVTMGLILADIPLCLVPLGYIDSEQATVFRIIVSLVMHLITLVALALSLGYTTQNEGFEDFIKRDPYAYIRMKKTDIAAAVFTFILCGCSVSVMAVVGLFTSYGLILFGLLSLPEEMIIAGHIPVVAVLTIIIYMATTFFGQHRARRSFLIVCLTFTVINMLPYILYPVLPALFLHISAIILIILSLKEKRILDKKTQAPM